MENKTVSFGELKRKIKLEEKKRKVAQAGGKFLRWCAANPEYAIGMAGTVLAGTRIIVKALNARQEDRTTYCRHWDPRTGSYSWSRRKLNKRERLEMDERYRAGESKLHILHDMGLLE